MSAPQAEPSRAEAFLDTQFPSTREIAAIEREIKPRARSRPVHCVHADILWRVRRGETVTVERMIAIYPFCTEGLMRQYVQQLRDWGYLSESDPTLKLAETD